MKIMHNGDRATIRGFNHRYLKNVNHRYLRSVFANHHPIPSSPSPPPTGLRLLSKAALPFIKAIESCWKRWQMVVLSSSPVWRARALPSFLISAMAVLCQAPRLSTARGRNTMNFWKSSERGGGHFQSRNLYCKFWTFKQGFLSIKEEKIAT